MEWKIQLQDQAKVAELAQAVGVSPVTAWVLMNRGVSDPDRARSFLAPSLEQLAPAAAMAGVEDAAARVLAALDAHETIGVHGDYDVDGMAGVALLVGFLRELGAKTAWRVPHRQQDGYGLSPRGVGQLREAGASLLITVDCGIGDFEAVDHARSLGLDVIVVDHHQLSDRLPAALAVINPHRPDCPFHGEDLTGVGAAFYLAVQVRARLRRLGRVPAGGGPNLKSYLDLVALGAIADVAPLTGLNRVLVHFGLEQINLSSRPGLIQLRRVAGLLERPVGAGQVSFQLAPRLNAAGRIDTGDLSVRLLLSDDEREAGLIADELERLNRSRRLVEERMLEEAVAEIEKTPGRSEAAALVVAGVDWHVGVIGIVASKLVERYHRPAAVIGLHAGTGKGSLRSLAGVNVHAALTRCSEHLLQFGGHPMAAGITVREDQVPAFARAFIAAVEAIAAPGAFSPALFVDAEWPVARCDLALVRELERLRPHGVGNPEPRFCARSVVVKWSREARNHTLLMGLAEKDVVVSAVGFGMADRPASPGDRIDLVYVPTLDDYQGQTRLKLRIKDYRKL